MFKRNIKKVISLTMAVVISAASISLTGCSITDIRQLREIIIIHTTRNIVITLLIMKHLKNSLTDCSKNLSLMIHCHYIPFLNILTNMALQIMMLPLDV